MRILVISLSKISKAFLKLQQGFQIDVYSPNSTIDGLNCVNDFAKLNGTYTHIFLGCKPQHVEGVAQSLQSNLYNASTVFISVLAGTKIEKIKKIFHAEKVFRKVFRIMPSLAFEFGNSFLAYYSEGLAEEESTIVRNLFGENHLLKCENEQEIDYFTGIYGSGIGFVFEVMNTLFEKSQSLFPTANNREMMLNLFQNACKYMQLNNNTTFFEATQNVASKGGTTEMGLNFLRNNNALQTVISGAIDEAIAKAGKM